MSRRRKVSANENAGAETDVVSAALRRVLEHAKSHGEAYPGALEDHAILQLALLDGMGDDAEGGLEGGPADQSEQQSERQLEDRAEDGECERGDGQ